MNRRSILAFIAPLCVFLTEPAVYSIEPDGNGAERTVGEMFPRAGAYKPRHALPTVSNTFRFDSPSLRYSSMNEVKGEDMPTMELDYAWVPDLMDRLRKRANGAQTKYNLPRPSARRFDASEPIDPYREQFEPNASRPESPRDQNTVHPWLQPPRLIPRFYFEEIPIMEFDFDLDKKFLESLPLFQSDSEQTILEPTGSVDGFFDDLAVLDLGLDNAEHETESMHETGQLEPSRSRMNWNGIAPSPASLLIQMGTVAFARRNYIEADKTFSLIVREEPEFPEAQFAYAFSKLCVGDYDEAHHAFSRSYELFEKSNIPLPHFEDLSINPKDVYYHQKRLIEYVNKNPDDTKARDLMFLLIQAINKNNRG